MSDHRALIEQAREPHHRIERGCEHQQEDHPCCWCCREDWPCLTARLADALEQQAAELALQCGISAGIFRDLVGRESEVSAAIARAGFAERRASELEQQLHDERLKADGICQEWAEKVDTAERDLAAAREQLEEATNCTAKQALVLERLDAALTRVYQAARESRNRNVPRYDLVTIEQFVAAQKMSNPLEGSL